MSIENKLNELAEQLFPKLRTEVKIVWENMLCLSFHEKTISIYQIQEFYNQIKTNKIIELNKEFDFNDTQIRVINGNLIVIFMLEVKGEQPAVFVQF